MVAWPPPLRWIPGCVFSSLMCLSSVLAVLGESMNELGAHSQLLPASWVPASGFPVKVSVVAEDKEDI